MRDEERVKKREREIKEKSDGQETERFLYYGYSEKVTAAKHDV